MKRFLLSAALVLLATSASASTRLTYYNAKGVPVQLYWNETSFPITYSIDPRLTQSASSIQNAFDSWQTVSGTSAAFHYGGFSAGERLEDHRNVVTTSNALFANSGFIAYTTTWFDDNTGEVHEADIEVDQRALSEGYNIESLVQHEVGHFLGLDHSAVMTSAMYPFVLPTRAPTLDSDDKLAVADLYPQPGTTAEVRGAVRDDNGPVFGAQVVALNERGEAVASALSDRSGRYDLAGLPAGNYRLYVEPLDGPVDPQNLSGMWRDTKATNFRTQFAANSLRVQAGQVTTASDLQLDGRPASLNPRWIGAFLDGAPSIQLGTNATSVLPGTTVNIAVGGDGIVSGMTTFEISNPGFVRVSNFNYGTNYVWATFRVDGATEPGTLTVIAKSGDESATLTGGIRVESKVRRRPVR